MGEGDDRLVGVMSALLPPGLRGLLATVGEAARATTTRPYLVGGTVRDLLLGQATFDVDVLVEGDAAALADRLGTALGLAITVHPKFGTATFSLPWVDWRSAGDPAARLPAGAVGLHLDLAAARTETYAHSGALPTVTLGVTVASDLGRRDFTANAMAVTLLAGEAGHLVDPHGGGDDLAAGRLAVLHSRSFEDDPTRLLRGVRLAGRLLLRFSPETEDLARSAISDGRLDRVSAERRRREVELLLTEARPGPALAYARALDLLPALHPALAWDAWVAERFGRALPAWAAQVPVAAVRLALLAWHWPPDTIAGALGRLRPDGATQATLETLPVWRERRPALLRASGGAAIAAALDGLGAATLAAARMAEDEPTVLMALDRYMTELRSVRPRLGGAALEALGLPPGPHYRPILTALRAAALDGRLPDEASEWAMLRRMVAEATASATMEGG